MRKAFAIHFLYSMYCFLCRLNWLDGKEVCIVQSCHVAFKCQKNEIFGALNTSLASKVQFVVFFIFCSN